MALSTSHQATITIKRHLANNVVRNATVTTKGKVITVTMTYAPGALLNSNLNTVRNDNRSLTINVVVA